MLQGIKLRPQFGTQILARGIGRLFFVSPTIQQYYLYQLSGIHLVDEERFCPVGIQPMFWRFTTHAGDDLSLAIVVLNGLSKVPLVQGNSFGNIQPALDEVQ